MQACGGRGLCAEAVITVLAVPPPPVLSSLSRLPHLPARLRVDPGLSRILVHRQNYRVLATGHPGLSKVKRKHVIREQFFLPIYCSFGGEHAWKILVLYVDFSRGVQNSFCEIQSD